MPALTRPDDASLSLPVGDPPAGPTRGGPSAERGGEDRRARLKDTLIDEAWRLLATEGLGAMQARRVAQCAGCSVGAIYNVFPDLDELILRANARTLKMLEQHLREQMASLTAETSLAARLDALARSYVDFAFAQDSAWRSLFDYRLTYTKPYPDWYRKAQADALDVFAEALAQAPSSLKRRLVETLWAAVHGVLAAGLDQRLHARSDAEILAQVELLLRLVTPTLTSPAEA
jgi:AcrR family transcriptional regulator